MYTLSGVSKKYQKLLGHVLGRSKRQIVANVAPPVDGRKDQTRRARRIPAADAQREPREGRAAAQP